MRFTRFDLVLLPVLVAVALLVVTGAFRLAGFLGLGVLGLLAAFIAVRIDLEADGVVGHPRTTGLFAETARRGRPDTPEEREARHAERQWLVRPLWWTLVASAGLIIFGFGGFFLYQLPG